MIIDKCQKIYSFTDLGAVSFIFGRFCKIDASTHEKTLVIKTALKVFAFAGDIFLSVFFFPYGLIAEGVFLAGQLLTRKVLQKHKISQSKTPSLRLPNPVAAVPPAAQPAAPSAPEKAVPAQAQVAQPAANPEIAFAEIRALHLTIMSLDANYINPSFTESLEEFQILLGNVMDVMNIETVRLDSKRSRESFRYDIDHSKFAQDAREFLQKNIDRLKLAANPNTILKHGLLGNLKIELKDFLRDHEIHYKDPSDSSGYGDGYGGYGYGGY